MRLDNASSFHGLPTDLPRASPAPGVAGAGTTTTNQGGRFRSFHLGFDPDACYPFAHNCCALTLLDDSGRKVACSTTEMGVVLLPLAKPLIIRKQAFSAFGLMVGSAPICSDTHKVTQERTMQAILDKHTNEFISILDEGFPGRESGTSLSLFNNGRVIRDGLEYAAREAYAEIQPDLVREHQNPKLAFFVTCMNRVGLAYNVDGSGLHVFYLTADDYSMRTYALKELSGNCAATDKHGLSVEFQKISESEYDKLLIVSTSVLDAYGSVGGLSKMVNWLISKKLTEVETTGFLVDDSSRILRQRHGRNKHTTALFVSSVTSRLPFTEDFTEEMKVPRFDRTPREIRAKVTFIASFWVSFVV